MSKNQITLIGNLGANPEVKNLENGNKVCRIDVCTTSGYKKEDGSWVNENTWHQVILWNKLADTQMSKGNEVYVEGKMTYRDYTDKEGIKRTTAEVVATVIKVFVRRERNEAPLPEPPPFTTNEEF